VPYYKITKKWAMGYDFLVGMVGAFHRFIPLSFGADPLCSLLGLSKQSHGFSEQHFPQRMCALPVKKKACVIKNFINFADK
jgi:hypothetical protein